MVIGQLQLRLRLLGSLTSVVGHFVLEGLVGEVHFCVGWFVLGLAVGFRFLGVSSCLECRATAFCCVSPARCAEAVGGVVGRL